MKLAFDIKGPNMIRLVDVPHEPGEARLLDIFMNNCGSQMPFEDIIRFELTVCCIYFIIIVLYHQIEVSIKFWYKHDSNLNFLFSYSLLARHYLKPITYRIFSFIPKKMIKKKKQN